MPKEDCPKYETCSATLCPLNNPEEESAYWYPDEEICRKHPVPDWVKSQKKIAKKVKDRSKYFTFKMLNRNCRITKGIIGLDPEKDEGLQLKKWLALHPTKKKMSLAQRKAVGERLRKYRQLKEK
ncbi:hypothetical protein ES703_115767 [subsurface metagenome]